MAADTASLRPTQPAGWRTGFANFLGRELYGWWGTRAWLTQIVIWLGLLNGIVAMVLFAAPDETLSGLTPAQNGMQLFFAIAHIFAAVGVIIMAQDAIIGEKQLGTAAWVLSKPLARPAFILAKVLAYGLGILVTIVAAQGAVAYAQTALVNGGPVAEPLPFLGALGLWALNLCFYLTLTLMLGTFFSQRGPVIGLPIAWLFSQQFLVGQWPVLNNVLPWSLDNLSRLLALGQPLPTLLPIATTAALSIVFIVVALWQFNRLEL